ncbi:Gfo/Idh/MocA family protein [Aureibacillus halotolerans]|uniref:Oxidoreductase family protein n=1 Tax=Aureibacillus halotolerans TaxID=1508390 RepID=A0A4R6UAL8_9BACI|nr:Gfo/Idh/MocA family oxidoreductase [Aureibacillus halotolerans]TDQ42932.1 oxidoreductase family protein [Aureibacillus halotolerans]
MKSYAVCGISNRAIGMFIKPLVTQYEQYGRLVGMLDADPRRFAVSKERLPQIKDVPTYSAEAFDQMVQETRPDVIIVASRDNTHIDYILKALEHDIDVITEKPMVTTAEDAVRAIEAEKASKGKIIVTFNYRYSPFHRKIKEMILDGKIGRVTSVDLNWYIDTYHGASYFKRWNRMREFSGGLSVHKSTHHFDLVQWWTDQRPVEAFAYGALNYYGPDGEHNPSKRNGRHCETCSEQNVCPYYTRWTTRTNRTSVLDDHIQGDQAAGSAYTGYRADQCIFDDEIEIEDTYTAVMKYDKGAMLSYSINFSLPYEGYRLAINGTKGRIETTEFHELSRVPFEVPEQTVDYFPLFGAKEQINVVQNDGGHGGGDPLLIEDIFLGIDPHRGYEILAGSEAGAYSIAAGEAIWKSASSGKPIQIKELLKPVSVQPN